MKIHRLHSWDVTPREARVIQEDLRSRVSEVWDGRPVNVVVGTDVSFPSKTEVLAAVVAVTYPDVSVLESVVRRGKCTFPYVPGFLAFREAPMLLEALSELKTRTDVVLCDGQGLAHPRGMGLACHVGILIDLPTVGCAKSLLYGTYDDPGEARGGWSPLLGKTGDRVGAVLRTRSKVSPVYVSVGHKIDLENAIDVVMGCSPKFRIPEPLRMAHKLAAGVPVESLRSGRSHGRKPVT
jgi:deoxyribonuclease V